MKLNLSIAVLAAAAIAFAASPADAQSKKKKGGKKAAKVTVSKAAPGGYWAGGWNSCASSASGMWYPIAAIGAVGCSVVYAVPVMIEGYVAPRAKA